MAKWSALSPPMSSCDTQIRPDKMNGSAIFTRESIARCDNFSRGYAFRLSGTQDPPSPTGSHANALRAGGQTKEPGQGKWGQGEG
jgi:hypothetical protein